MSKMHKILIGLCAVIVITSAKPDAGPDSHYLTRSQFTQFYTNFTDCFDSKDSDSLFKYTIPHLNQSLPNITFSKLKGKVILVVNVATYCQSSFEYPKYNQLIQQFGDKLVIVAFPTNHFQNQEPSNSVEEIYNAMKYVRPGKGFVPKFPLAQKVDANGPNAHPIFSYLKRSCASTRVGFMPKEYLLYDPKNSRDIRWNFEKFLIDPNTGKPVRRYDQLYDPILIGADIKRKIAEIHN